ncbi:hypothetical protein [Ferrimonas marina]|uniref:Uncharacterized protein n=1 Tax=Ferrimonas marina TaxID=299255 RepID=A0A1M5ZAK7_9GAMM|nr:hypothetical protein [Ferrimonas marina]SHI21254.1 hypothetical protein SAMN02745129_0108 [Ferrimonas marina]
MNFNRYKMAIPASIGRIKLSRYEFLGTWLPIYALLWFWLQSGVLAITHGFVSSYGIFTFISLLGYYLLYWCSNYWPVTLKILLPWAILAAVAGLAVGIALLLLPATLECLPESHQQCTPVAALEPEQHTLLRQGTTISWLASWGLHLSVVLIAWLHHRANQPLPR